MKGKEVKQVTLPGVDGGFGVLAGHVPTVAELGPGVTEIYEEADSKPQRYFISGGFAFIHPESVTDLSATEAVAIEDLDGNEVENLLTSAKQEVDAASDEKERAIAQIKLDVAEAMKSALNSK